MFEDQYLNEPEQAGKDDVHPTLIQGLSESELLRVKLYQAYVLIDDNIPTGQIVEFIVDESEGTSRGLFRHIYTTNGTAYDLVTEVISFPGVDPDEAASTIYSRAPKPAGSND